MQLVQIIMKVLSANKSLGIYFIPFVFQMKTFLLQHIGLYFINWY